MKHSNKPDRIPILKIVARQISTVILALAMGLATALFMMAILALVNPEIFGSCFEASCGYVALYFLAPIATVFAAVAWWFVLSRVGLLVHLLLWFVFVLVVGYFVLDPFVWAVSLAGLPWVVLEIILRQCRAAR